MCLDGLCFLLFSDDLPLPATHTHPHATRSLPHATAVVGVGVGAWGVASGVRQASGARQASGGASGVRGRVRRQGAAHSQVRMCILLSVT